MNNHGQQTNYNRANGDIINQSGTFNTGIDKRIMRDNIDTQINNDQDLAQAAQEIKALLNQLSADYPNDSYEDLSAKAVKKVDKNPQLKSRIMRGVKEGSLAALETMIDHPGAQFFIKFVEEVFILK
ncbi:hypothetical protein [Okeania sp.]|uniref:hypothetical protein n=1 Tax=Okeania sp. TaxID=3100323 RepID=UPI002B4B8302|nr:hypothetical protein [Okeania sp.]MEB3342794.1 hypothetical protein [Okeania sp.]